MGKVVGCVSAKGEWGIGDSKSQIDIVASSDLCRWANIRLASNWWKDVCRLGELARGAGDDWCRAVMAKRIGNGGTTKFWLDVWLGLRPLCVVFPRLFLISTQQDLTILDVGGWEEEVWVWNLQWRRTFFAWEEALIEELNVFLREARLTKEEDGWVCNVGADDNYKVKEGYVFLCQNFLPPTDMLEPVCAAITYKTKSPPQGCDQYGGWLKLCLVSDRIRVGSSFIFKMQEGYGGVECCI
ncbi:hypothetical protein TSUD_223550 [Trifolium subterraneum]|uniref:Reverse transcriptase zinc-binding domain-containing protein n=1 Tax=Trifolium subterraneum TaxID=3900 RepID=A0A2Z6NDN3_TRISU|nr:hypothetical protein TSUD_223550 [Trifolium subterraneum]